MSVYDVKFVIFESLPLTLSRNIKKIDSNGWIPKKLSQTVESPKNCDYVFLKVNLKKCKLNNIVSLLNTLNF